MENIEKFNECAAHILSRLYKEFPVGRKLPSDEIVVELGGAITADIIKGINANSFVAHTVIWLTEAGYISIVRNAAARENNRYILTPKSLELLNTDIPDDLKGKLEGDNKETIGEKLTKLAGSLGKQVGQEVAKQGTSKGIALLLGYILGTD